MDAIGRTFGGMYRAERLLGKGGMGEVYEAVGVDAQTNGERVALKILNERLNDNKEMKARFTREAEIAARLDSPHVARLRLAGINSMGCAWIAFELLEGETLLTRLRRDQRLPVSMVRWIIEDVLRGLEHAHAASVIHRDIKPSNIFLVRGSPSETAKVLDFGVSRFARTASTSSTSPLTAMDMVVGTPMYMSPEQSTSARVDHRADLYSVAVVAFRALSGGFPFVGETIEEVTAYKQVHAPRTLEAAGLERAPQSLEAFFRFALARALGARAQSAKEALVSWQQACADAGPDSSGVTRCRVIDPDVDTLVEARGSSTTLV